ncbi:hypothetical protein DFJ74DRAFT_702898 [Hyaloraphidium curvatum]|nr:hypothetical protein DFJ74DRAFT_702898 [Hyaloraphidium curvatum]
MSSDAVPPTACPSALPFEVIDCILGFLSDDRRALLACVRIRVLHDSAALHLWKRVEIPKPTMMEPLEPAHKHAMEILRRPVPRRPGERRVAGRAIEGPRTRKSGGRPYAHYVRSLEIRAGYPEIRTTDLSDLLRNCAGRRLESLAFSADEEQFPRWRDAIESAPDLFGQLTELKLFKLDRTWTGLRDWLQQFCGLRSLLVEHPTSQALQAVREAFAACKTLERLAIWGLVTGALNLAELVGGDGHRLRKLDLAYLPALESLNLREFCHTTDWPGFLPCIPESLTSLELHWRYNAQDAEIAKLFVQRFRGLRHLYLEIPFDQSFLDKSIASLTQLRKLELVHTGYAEEPPSLPLKALAGCAKTLEMLRTRGLRISVSGPPLPGFPAVTDLDLDIPWQYARMDLFNMFTRPPRFPRVRRLWMRWLDHWAYIGAQTDRIERAVATLPQLNTVYVAESAPTEMLADLKTAFPTIAFAKARRHRR